MLDVPMPAGWGTIEKKDKLSGLKTEEEYKKKLEAIATGTIAERGRAVTLITQYAQNRQMLSDLLTLEPDGYSLNILNTALSDFQAEHKRLLANPVPKEEDPDYVYRNQVMDCDGHIRNTENLLRKLTNAPDPLFAQFKMSVGS